MYHLSMASKFSFFGAWNFEPQQIERSFQGDAYEKMPDASQMSGNITSK